MSINNTAESVAKLVAARMANIRIANGCETDIGQTVFRGRRKIDDDQVGTGCVSIVEGDDTISQEVGGRVAQVALQQKYGLVAYVPCDPDHPNDAAHAAIRDLKRAIFAGDATFGQQVRKVVYTGRLIGARADGAAIVQVLVEIGVDYVETLSAP
jgi:hypothetical protein